MEQNFVKRQKLDSAAIETPTTISYTYDGLPIRTVYVDNFQKPMPIMSYEELRDYFETFGPIASVRQSTYCAFAKFIRAEDATTFLMSKRFRARPADGFHQQSAHPDIKKSSENSKYPLVDDVSDFALCRLNNDCLSHLFQFLNIMDILSLSRTCVRIQELAEPDLRKKCKTIDFGDTLKLQGENDYYLYRSVYYSLLNDLGKYIKSLKISNTDLELILFHDNYVNILDNVYRSCASLQQLHLVKIHLMKFDNKPAQHQNEEAVLPQLKTLELDGCKFGDLYNMTRFGQLSRLTELHLHGVHEFFFSSLSGLEKLNVTFNDHDDLPKFVKLCRTNADTLTHLTGMSHSSFPLERLVNILPKLVYLDTNCLRTDDALVTARLEHIKTLRILCCANVAATLLHLLTTNNKVIEELAIDVYQRSVLDEKAKQDLLKLTTLHKLILCEIEIDSSFLVECAKALHKLRVLGVESRNDDVGMFNDDHLLDFVRNADQLTELYVGKNSEKFISPNIIVKVANVWKSLGKQHKLMFGIRFRFATRMVAKELYKKVNSIIVKWDYKLEDLHIPHWIEMSKIHPDLFCKIFHDDAFRIL